MTEIVIMDRKRQILNMIVAASLFVSVAFALVTYVSAKTITDGVPMMPLKRFIRE